MEAAKNASNCFRSTGPVFPGHNPQDVAAHAAAATQHVQDNAAPAGTTPAGVQQEAQTVPSQVSQDQRSQDNIITLRNVLIAASAARKWACRPGDALQHLLQLFIIYMCIMRDTTTLTRDCMAARTHADSFWTWLGPEAVFRFSLVMQQIAHACNVYAHGWAPRQRHCIAVLIAAADTAADTRDPNHTLGRGAAMRLLNERVARHMHALGVADIEAADRHPVADACVVWLQRELLRPLTCGETVPIATCVADAALALFTCLCIATAKDLSSGCQHEGGSDAARLQAGNGSGDSEMTTEQAALSEPLPGSQAASPKLSPASLSVPASPTSSGCTSQKRGRGESHTQVEEHAPPSREEPALKSCRLDGVLATQSAEDWELGVLKVPTFPSDVERYLNGGEHSVPGSLAGVPDLKDDNKKLFKDDVMAALCE